MYIAAFAGTLTLLRRGSGMDAATENRIACPLLVVFTVGLVVGSYEHFFIAGPNNVFDVGDGDWTLLFKISIAILCLLEFAGLSVSGRMLATRS